MQENKNNSRMVDLTSMVDKIGDFPTLPTIYTSLMESLSNPRSTVQDVADVILKDQSSTLKILKIVNSVAYGLQNRIDTISQAIFYIGFNEVKNIVLTLSVIDVFSSTKSLTYFNLVDLWKHSIAVGVVSRKIAKVIGVKNTENYFLAGIVHDIGKLFFMRTFGDEYNKIVKYGLDNKLVITDAENEIYGFNHMDVGEMLAEKWQLPSSIQHAIKNHHNDRIKADSPELTVCVHLADVIARIMELGNPGDSLVYTPSEEVWKILQIPPETFVKMYNGIINEYRQSVGILLLK
ncbi:MAG: HDOD domain-containing protein [Ignavibacteriae bacterium]|nr:HDOD domain-containing protein [Ignavibacteriota bacterium]